MSVQSQLKIVQMGYWNFFNKNRIKYNPSVTLIAKIKTGISIRFNRVTYEISYFVNGDYKAIWMDECEFEIDKKETVKIGFKN
jgi:hypothetical protein